MKIEQVENIVSVLNSGFVGEVVLSITEDEHITENFTVGVKGYDAFIEYVSSVEKTRFFKNSSRDYDKYVSGETMKYGIAFKGVHDDMLKVFSANEKDEVEVLVEEKTLSITNKTMGKVVFKATKNH